MRSISIVLMSVLALSACSEQENTVNTQVDSQSVAKAEVEVASSSTESISETQKLNAWFEEQYETELMQSPVALTFQGRKERYTEVDDMSEAAQAKNLEWKRKSVAEMKSTFDYDQLSDDAKLSYDLWEFQYNIAAEGDKFKRSGYVFEQMNGTHSFFPTFLMNFHKVSSAEDMQAYIARLTGFGRAMNQLIERAKLSADEGVRPPRFAYEIVIKETEEIITGAEHGNSDEDSTLMTDIKTKLATLVKSESIDQKRSDAMLVQAKTALVNDFGAAYKNLLTFLNDDIENTSDVAKGVSSLPKGEAYYAYLLKRQTTTDMSAEDVHNLGLSEVKRLRTEMEALKTKSGFDGSLQDFFAYIRDSKDNEKFYFSNTDEGRQGYIDDATAAINNIKAQLPNYFGILPKAELEVKRVEPFREQDGAPQHYYPGTPDGSRPGIYYAHLSDMKAMPKNELEVIAYHEGLPGHHMQISIAQELTGVPTFRTQAGFTAYAEGWALYSESLAREMPGTFSDIHSDFGRLGSEIWRAIRLVVDTGMHQKGWSQQQAIDYFSANSPAPLTTIEAEIRRYLVIPGQATSYKVGMIAIQGFRKKAEQALGDKFDIRAFHDAVLDGGALPMSMLERKIDAWIASQK